METFNIVVEFHGHKVFEVDAENVEEAKEKLSRDLTMSSNITGWRNEETLLGVVLYTNEDMMTVV